MTTVEISGHTRDLNSVLERCLASGVFQPENAAKLSEYSVGTAPFLRNPYGGLLVKIGEAAAQRGWELIYQAPHQPLIDEARRESYVDDTHEALTSLGENGEETLTRLYCQTKFLYEAYDLRKYVVSIRELFHVIGFVLTEDKDQFLSLLKDLPQVTVVVEPASRESRIQTPVKLKNNWFARPFEMFVEMYGSPSYNDIDPTPFVSFTYCLLFGIMFGDLGQGLCISLLGLYLSKKKGMALGGIMTRIGISSAIFGVVYGSVFGYEHLLDPLFHRLGFHEKPIEIMDPGTTNLILLSAVGLGIAIILTVILFNICIGIKQRRIDRAVFSHNGLAGLVFYGGVLFAAVMAFNGKDVLSLPYILLFIALPLLLIFFKEPMARLVGLRSTGAMIHRYRKLMESTEFKHADVDFTQLFTTTKYVVSRFGRIPTDSYKKLSFYYMDDPFVIYPLKTDTQYIWCIYAMAASDKEQVDAIFHDLYFERILVPDDALETPDKAEAYIKSVIDSCTLGTSREEQAQVAGERSLMARIFPHGVGEFIVESFFELFEVLLSYVTNTMSFLRVGGFILSHAGMMSVVMTLSEMVGAGASPVVVIFGNLFVMGLEGLIVGIQCLRLEFYEMFSRFYDAQGVPFTPVKAGSQSKAG